MVPEVSFLNRSALITFPGTLNTENFKNKFSCFVKHLWQTGWQSVLGIDYSCRSGVQQAFPQVPLCTSGAGQIPAGLLLLHGNVPHLSYPFLCWWQLHMLVHSWLRKVSPVGIWAQAAAVAQPGLICMGWARLGECQAPTSCPAAAAWAALGAPGLLQGTGPFCLCWQHSCHPFQRWHSQSLMPCLCVRPALLAESPQPHGSALPCQGEGPHHSAHSKYLSVSFQHTSLEKKTLGKHLGVNGCEAG